MARKGSSAVPTTHESVCVAQNANPLFEGAYHCICASPPKEATPKQPNPCHGAYLEKVPCTTTHYAVTLPFKPSSTQLTAYATVKKHKVPTKKETPDEDTHPDEVESRNTFNDDAIRTLRMRYPSDPLYPMIEGYRVVEKALGTYVAKIAPGSKLRRGTRLHDRFRHTPKTLRLAMELLQVLPRPVKGDPNDPRVIYDEIRRCFVPDEGKAFVAADFSNVEPLLVAYFAQDASFLRACRVSSHSWFASNVVGEPPDFKWSDEDIEHHYTTLKSRAFTLRGQTLSWKQVRDGCKTAGMASLYAGGPGEISRANPDIFPDTKTAKYYQDAFFALCPRVRSWHWETAETAERQGYLLTPIGFRLHYYDLFSYVWSESQGRWATKLNRNAKEAIAAVPQHTGMMYVAAAVQRLSPEHREFLRLLIHDEVFGEVPVARTEEFLGALKAAMEVPHPLMPLWPEAQALTGMTHLSVKTEAKMSVESWGAMA